MLDLGEEKVAELKSAVTDEDDDSIREKCGFKKNAVKYPLVYKETANGKVTSFFLDYIGICLDSDDKGMQSLLIQTDDGRWTRICAMLLKEMQDPSYGITGEGAGEDSLFG